LLCLSALFSGTETAFFTLDKTTRNLLENDDNSASKRVLKLLTEPQRLLITILFSNNVVNIFIATQATILTQDLASQFEWDLTLSLIVNVGLVSFLILMIGEVLPKIYAVKDPLWLTKRVSLFITVIQALLLPITFFLTKYTNGLTLLFKIKINSSGFSEEELKTLIDLSEESGSIENEEKEMISSIMDFGDTSVKEIMVPRIDMITIKHDAELNDLLDVAKESHYSRIPVYEERIDNIIGLVFIKDLIAYINNDRLANVTIKSLLHDCFYVPEQKKIQDLLKEFQSQKMHMAIVVDEYGGTSGLVTLEDILEEIVGEIQDEYDTEDPLYTLVDDSTFIIDGKMPIEEFNNLLPVEIPDEDDIETISGFIHHLTGKLPEEGDIITHENLSFTIEKVDQRRIDTIRLEILPEKPNTFETDRTS
jgi:gliding motility-associated protein GldE